MHPLKLIHWTAGFISVIEIQPIRYTAHGSTVYSKIVCKALMLVWSPSNRSWTFLVCQWHMAPNCGKRWNVYRCHGSIQLMRTMLQVRVAFFWMVAIFSGKQSKPRLPRESMMPSAAARMLWNARSACRVSTLAMIFTWSIFCVFRKSRAMWMSSAPLQSKLQGSGLDLYSNWSNSLLEHIDRIDNMHALRGWTKHLLLRIFQATLSSQVRR